MSRFAARYGGLGPVLLGAGLSVGGWANPWVGGLLIAVGLMWELGVFFGQAVFHWTSVAIVNEGSKEGSQTRRYAAIVIQSELEDTLSGLEAAVATAKYRMPHDQNNVFSTEQWNGLSPQLLIGTDPEAYKLADVAVREIRKLNARVSPRFPLAREAALRTVLSLGEGDRDEILTLLPKVQRAIQALQDVQEDG